MEKSPDTVSGYIAALEHGDLEKRRAATRHLADIGEAALPALIKLMQETESNDVRWYCARALSLMGRPAAGPLLSATILLQEEFI